MLSFFALQLYRHASYLPDLLFAFIYLYFIQLQSIKPLRLMPKIQSSTYFIHLRSNLLLSCWDNGSERVTHSNNDSLISQIFIDIMTYWTGRKCSEGFQMHFLSTHFCIWYVWKQKWIKSLSIWHTHTHISVTSLKWLIPLFVALPLREPEAQNIRICLQCSVTPALHHLSPSVLRHKSSSTRLGPSINFILSWLKCIS